METMWSAGIGGSESETEISVKKMKMIPMEQTGMLIAVSMAGRLV